MIPIVLTSIISVLIVLTHIGFLSSGDHRERSDKASSRLKTNGKILVITYVLINIGSVYYFDFETQMIAFQISILTAGAAGFTLLFDSQWRDKLFGFIARQSVVFAAMSIGAAFYLA